MFTGPMIDRRAHAILLCRILVERVENADVPLEFIGGLARELAEMILDDAPTEDGTTTVVSAHRLRVIEGGRH